MTKCLMCQSSNNLNTKMTLSIDGQSYNICLCDEHAENTTMASLRTRLLEIKKDLENAIQKAKDAGIYTGAVVPAQKEEPTQPQEPTQSTEPTQPQEPTQAIERLPDISGTSAAPTEANNNNNNTTNNNTLVEGVENPNKVVKVNTIQGRDGKPTQIPEHIEGDFGTTDIRIANVSDDVIQRRFKSLDDMAPNEGYSKPCNMCRGQGFNAITGDICQKCKGSGVRII